MQVGAWLVSIARSACGAVTTGDLLQPSQGIRAPLKVAFTSDSKLLATGSDDGTIRLWNAKTGDATGIFVGHEVHRWISALAFSEDGRKLFSASEDGTVRIWPLFSDARDFVTKARGLQRAV